MSQGRRKRILKDISKDGPPFEPMSPKDVQLIARAGDLGSADDNDLYDELELLRLNYLPQFRWREIAATDWQLRAEIHGALEHMAGLRAFFSNGSVVMASSVLFYSEPEQLGAVPDTEHPDRLRMFAKQHEALGYLEQWTRRLNDNFEQQAAKNPNFLAPPPAAMLGLTDLVIGLANLWRRRSGKNELPDGRKSPWLAFLQQSLKAITQRSFDEGAARKLTHRALKHSTSVRGLTGRGGVWR
jgi:hypothetical protein